MAKLDLALVVRTVDKATQPLRRIQKSVRDIGRQTGLDRVSRGVGRVGRQMRKVGSEALLFGKKFGLLASGAGALVGGFALKASAQMETLQVSFESMLGSAAKAKDMVRNLSDFAAKTPFQLLDIGSATKSLLAFGVKAKDMIGTLSFLGDIAAGAGVPLKDLAQIYGKTMAKGKAQTEELNQLSERGIPILEALVKLAASYGNEISKEDVYKAAEKGQITFKAIEEALKLMTAEGAIFADQMEKQSETMAGLGSTVRDNVFNAFATLGDRIEKTFSIKPGMKGFITWLQELNAELKKPAGQQIGAAKAITQSLNDIKTAFAAVKKVAEDVSAVFKTDLGKAVLAMGEEIGWARVAVGVLSAWLGVGLLKAIVGLFKPLAALGWAIVVAGARMLWLAGVAIVSLLAGLGRLAAVVLPSVIAAFSTLAAVLWANPIVLIIAGIVSAVAVLAGSAYLIYKNWDDIAAYFERTWREIKAAFPVDQWIDALGNKKTAFFAAVTGWWAGIDEWFGAKWGAFVSLIPEFIRDGLGIDVSPDGREASPHGAATPSLFAPSAAAGGRGSAIAGAREGNAHVTVDFRNMPRGTRTETRADSDTDLEVITGYAMQGAG